MTTGYKIRNQEAPHYLTFQIVGWIDIFTREVYKEFIIDNLKYCQKNKGLIVYAFVIMSNHIHLIIQSENGALSNTIRDFKGYTSKMLIKLMNENTESRRDWMINYFKEAAKKHQRNPEYQIWTHENHPVELFSNELIEQKLDYIHLNPVKAGIVREPEDYIYSSASNYAGLDSVLNVEILSRKWKTI